MWTFPPLTPYLWLRQDHSLQGRPRYLLEEARVAFAILRVEVTWARGAEGPASRHTFQAFKACVFSPATPARHTYTQNHTRTRSHVHVPIHPPPRSPLSPCQETSRQLEVNSLSTALLQSAPPQARSLAGFLLPHPDPILPLPSAVMLLLYLLHLLCPRQAFGWHEGPQLPDQLPCLHPGPSVMGHTAQRRFLKFKPEPMLPVQQPPMAACLLTQCGRTTLPHSFASQPPARATATGPEGNQREIPLPLLGPGKRQGVSPSAHILTSCPRFLFYRIGTPSTPRQGLLKEAAQLF